MHFSLFHPRSESFRHSRALLFFQNFYLFIHYLFDCNASQNSNKVINALVLVQRAMTQGTADIIVINHLEGAIKVNFGSDILLQYDLQYAHKSRGGGKSLYVMSSTSQMINRGRPNQ